MDHPHVPARPPAPGAPAPPAGRPGMACWICSRPVARFEPYGVPPRIGRCPHCGAKPRSRALVRLVRDRIRPRLAAGDRVLEIGPSRFSADHLIGSRLFGPAHCVAVDVRRRHHHRRLGAGGRFVAASAAKLAFADASFDFILCNNTLPYIREDRLALAEVARCLERDGLAMIDTHRGPGATRTAHAHRREHPGLGEEWFAANGDAWVYGGGLPRPGAGGGAGPGGDGAVPGRPCRVLHRQRTEAAGPRPVRIAPPVGPSPVLRPRCGRTSPRPPGIRPVPGPAAAGLSGQGAGPGDGEAPDVTIVRINHP